MVTFFFDNDISFRIVNALRELVNPQDGYELVALRDKFPVSEKDVNWIPEAGKNGWIVISRDYNQRRRGAEYKALRQHHATVLYIRQSGKAVEMFHDAARIIKNWPKIAGGGSFRKAGSFGEAGYKRQDRDALGFLPAKCHCPSPLIP